MTKVVVNLSGWADGLSNTQRKIYFPIQMALYEVTHDCDWEIKALTSGKYVSEEFKIIVMAKRCYSIDYAENQKPKSHYSHKNFKFTVPNFTLENVYKYALEALKRSK
jgi:hypothetical protein